ncbi:NTP transferase domain-containing protein [Candidatus Neomarinimicrobiota bacterium]
MQAIIVAAGEGTRLRPLTESRPKALLDINDRSLITRSIGILQDVGVTDFALVVGYREEMIKEHLAELEITWFSNPLYQSTNNMASLRIALPFIKETFLYLHSDLIYDPRLLQQIVVDSNPNVLLVERKSCNAEDMKVKVEGGILVESNKEIPLAESFGEWTGIAKFSSSFAEVLLMRIGILMEQGHQQAYDTLAFTELAREGHTISIAEFDGLPWVEIDTWEDLEQARQLFSP